MLFHARQHSQFVLHYLKLSMHNGFWHRVLGMSRYPANIHQGVMPSSYKLPIFLYVPKPFTAGQPRLGELEEWDTFHPCPDQRVPRAPSPKADWLNPTKFHIRVSYLCGRYFMTTAIHIAYLGVHLSQLLGPFVGHILSLLLVEDHEIQRQP